MNHQIALIWHELKKLRKNKTNICAFQDLMNRVNYLETTQNELIQTVRRLEDELQELSRRADNHRD